VVVEFMVNVLFEPNPRAEPIVELEICIVIVCVASYTILSPTVYSTLSGIIAAPCGIKSAITMTAATAIAIAAYSFFPNRFLLGADESGWFRAGVSDGTEFSLTRTSHPRFYVGFRIF
jgi:hypothetical protein